MTCTVYGKEVVKTVKTFLATHATFGGTIRMVIIQEEHGPQFFYCTDINSTVREIIETFADRSTIEQVFYDVKEVWGAGQQQVRNLWSNIGCWHLNLWLFTLTELWAWPLNAKHLTQRDDSPWDTADRRPSHADKRKALQTQCLLNELSPRAPPPPSPEISASCSNACSDSRSERERCPKVQEMLKECNASKNRTGGNASSKGSP